MEQELRRLKLFIARRLLEYLAGTLKKSNGLFLQPTARRSFECVCPTPQTPAQFQIVFPQSPLRSQHALPNQLTVFLNCTGPRVKPPEQLFDLQDLIIVGECYLFLDRADLLQ